jgi:tRNA pseudouridine38-40 synthase
MRIVLGISYQGTHYHGWQQQPGLHTIQSLLEESIQKVADHAITLTCAGRTDKGVHAIGQVAHFDTTAIRNQHSWLFGVNSQLPKAIRVDWVRETSDEFHARFSAQARYYKYVIYNHPIASSLWDEHVTHFYHPLDEIQMQKAGNYLLGEHDFSSFRASSCQSNSAIRKIISLNVQRIANYVIVRVGANAFLHHMVRNIAGLLMQIGSGKYPATWAEEVLLAKDRTLAAMTAKPNGLYLSKVIYPVKFDLPSRQTYFFNLMKRS